MEKNSLHERVNVYSGYLKKKYGEKVFRVGLSTGIVCPHRSQNGGCIFCLPKSFTGDYQRSRQSVTEQLKEAIPLIYKSCGKVKLIAYFQDETSTACSLAELKYKIEETLLYEEIVGIVISTRPDYIQDEILAYFQTISKPILLEIGMQTIHEKSLDFLQRGHSFLQSKAALETCAKHGIPVGVHLILGIPGESLEDMKQTIQFITDNTTIQQVKFHNLVVYLGTKLHAQYQKMKIPLYTIEEHVENLTELLPFLRGDVVITRFFTSNILNTQPTFYQYEGNKTKWMNQLRTKLIEKNSIQGLNTNKPFHFQAI
jgi:hypothetical protein